METPTQKAVRVLNELYTQDPDALSAMLCYYVPINSNDFAAEHPTIQFSSNPTTKNARLSFLGLLNGIVGDPNGMCVASEWAEEANEDGTHDLLGFCETEIVYAET